MGIKDYIRSTRFITYEEGGVEFIKDTQEDQDYLIDKTVVDLLNDLDADYKLMRIDRDKFHMLFKQWMTKYIYLFRDFDELRKNKED